MSIWTFVCAGCNQLAQAERQHAITCSDACRVHAHRNGSAKALRALAGAMKIDASGIVHAKAICALRPDLDQSVMAGTLTIAEAQPDVNRAFVALLFSQIGARQ